MPITESGLWTLDAQEVPYEFLMGRVIIYGNMGNCQIPVAVPWLPGPSGVIISDPPDRPSCEIGQMVAPFGRRIVQWAGQRMGGLPVMPQPDPQDQNQILHEYFFESDPPPLKEDGVNHIYRAALTYVYFVLKPIWLLDNLNMGATPYDVTPASANVFSASFFQYGLQTPNPSGGVGGSGVGAIR